MATDNSNTIEILLVEDNPGDVRLTQEAFREARLGNHLNINVTRDGVEASDFLWRRGRFVAAPRPHLILLDLNLPRKNGRELLQEIKADSDLRRIPVMVLSTSRAEQDLKKVYDLHANCYITKPERLDQFMEMVRTMERFWCNVVTLPSD